MDLDFHCWRFDWAGGPAGIGRRRRRPRAAGRGARRAHALVHGPLLPDGAGWRPPRTRCSRATPRSASSPAAPSDAAAAPARHRRDLPPSRAAGQDGHDARRALGRAGRARASAPPGTSASTAASACRSRRVAERFERLEEAIQICLQMWSDDDGPFDGRHYQLAETLCRPTPVSAPRPRDHDRRRRRAEDAAARRAVRRRVQHLRRSRRGRAQGRRAAPPLRRGRARPERDRGHGDVPRPAAGRDAPTTSCAAPRRSRRSACRRSSPARSATDPAGWLESTFGPAIDRIQAIEPASL